MAQAQVDLSAFNGLWMQDSVKFRNVIYAGAVGSATVPERGVNEAYKEYMCMEVDPANLDIISLYTYDKYGNYMDVYGYLYWQSGTNSDFFGYVEFFSEDGSEYNFAYVTVINGKFTAVPGYGYYSGGTEFVTWDFLWNGKIPRTVPSDIYAVGCGL